jgi:hypothetical protein
MTFLLTNKPSHNRFSKEYVDSLYERHLKGESYLQIAKSLNKDPSTISKLFSKRGLKNISENGARTSRSKFNERFFKKINTHEKAYLLGLIYADGYIYKNKKDAYSFGIALKESDKYIIEYIKESLDWSGSIYYSEKTKSYKLQINSKPLVLDLMSHGVCFRKSYQKLSVPNMKKIFLNSFILGFFDGDGTIGLYNKFNSSYTYVHTSICSSDINILNEMQKILIDNDIKSNIRCDKRSLKGVYNDIYILYIYSKSNNLLLFIEFIYRHSKLFLIRKKEKAIQANTVLNLRLKSLKSV